MGQILGTLSVYSLEEHLKRRGRDSLFSGLVLPDTVDRETCIDVILTESEPFEAVYQNPDYLRAMITLWGKKWQQTFTKWASALELSYDPLYNYDRYEDIEDVRTDSNTKTLNTNKQRTDNLQQENNLVRTDNTQQESVQHNETSGTDTDATTDTNEVTAYDAGTLYTHDKQTRGGNISREAEGDSTGTITNTGTVSDTGTVKNTGTQNEAETGTVADQGEGTNRHTAHIYGNIGVTTSSAMLKEYLEIQEWNLYKHIADLFLEEFCIMVY